jgi:hypothetical protein
MQDGVARGKLAKSFTGGRFLVSADDLQEFRRSRGPLREAKRGGPPMLLLLVV